MSSSAKAPGYSDLKVIHGLEKIGQLRNWRNQTTSMPLKANRPVPGQVQLILSDLCNHDCSFCAYRMSGYSSNANFADALGNKNPNRMIPVEKALEILDDCSDLGVRGVQYTGGGEPTVHPDHLSIMRRGLGRSIKSGLVTNGCLLRPGWDEVYPRFAWLRISMDAGNSIDYARIRKVSQTMYGKMLSNMESLANADVPSLGASFIATKENWRGICSAATAAKNAGASYFRVGAMYGPQMEHYYDGILERIKLEVLKAVGEHGDFVFDQFTTRVNFMGRKPTNAFCGYQLLNVYIGGDQKVYRCCEYAYNDHGYLGDLTDMTFADWFRSQEADEKYKCFDATKCETCPFHTKNELIEFMSRGDISEMHPEFP